jgi:CspA family cold shock protein
MSDQKQKGRVKWFNPKKGYGFIDAENGQSVFVHFSSIAERGYRSLEEGDVVEFDVEESPKGPAARSVKRLSSSTKFSDVQRKP